MRYLFGTTAMLALVVAGHAGAQTASPPTQGGAPGPSSTAAANANTVETVVVTARKTAEKVRDIPATITAVTSVQLTQVGPVAGTGDLLRSVPGVRFNNLQASNLSEISIRGSGTERATGADSGVGLFVNGAYVGSSTLGGRNFKNIDFFDVDRVEVLEGPQSALYGRNSEFGVVNIVSAKPKFDDSGFLNETYTSELGKNDLVGVVNHAFSDDVALRLSAETIGQTSGFYKNPDNNSYYDQTSGWIGRGQLRYKHGPLDVDLLVDSQDLFLPTFVSGYAIAPHTLATVPLGFSNDRFNVPSDGVNSTEQRVQRAQLMADYDLGWATMTSTTMATHSNSLQYYGSSIDLGIESQLQGLGEAGAYPLSQVHTGANDGTDYEDLHLTGKALDGALNWLVGGEILDQHDSNLLTVGTSPCTLTATSGICGGTPTTPICYELRSTSKSCPTPFPAGFGTESYTPEHYTSQAAYASLGYTIDKFTLSGELRYTNDLKTATQYSSALYTGVQTVKPASYRFAAGRASYNVTLSYKLPGPWDDMIYAKTGTGYRAGGVNTGTSSPFAPVPFRPTYGDEDTTSYEAGVKGGVGSHVFVTLDGYTSRTLNAITNISDGCSLLNACGQGATAFNINGGTVQATGVELAVNSRFELAGGRLDLSLNGAHQHAQFVSRNGNYNGLPIVNSLVAQVPDWTESVDVNYAHTIWGGLDGFAHVSYQGQSGGGQDTVTSVAPFVPLASISNVDLRAGVDYGKMEAAVFVGNLTNQTVRLLTLQTVGITTSVRYNQPRTVGANLIYRW